MSEPPLNYEVAIETASAADLAAILAKHPDISTFKFWHGQSALHKICLRQDATVEMLSLLLKAGADVNAKNNYEETPLMFAAKRGSSNFCQFLISNGGDKDGRDKAGRTFIHHAVMGGSNYIVHYLRELHACNLDVEDGRKQTPLHVACSQGNLSMVNYLLRSLQCDCRKADAFGNTPLHHAAVYGHEQVVSSLLTHSGLSALDAVNLKGQSPIDVCSGKGSVHLATMEVFAYALEQKKKGYKYLQPPRALWFWYLIMPAVFFLIGGLFAEIFHSVWYTGVVIMSLTLVYILYLFQVHSHRIKHFTRLPNPMYAGAFGAGLIGTFVAWLTFVLPRMHVVGDSINTCVCLLTLLFVIPTYYLYWLLITGDPGFLPLTDRGVPASSAHMQELKSTDSGEKFCADCDIFSAGVSVKHCKLCERCVVHMDHHCLFLLKCVASQNHRLFTIFIAVVNFDILLFLLSTFRCMSQFYDFPEFPVLVDRLALDYPVMFFVVILNLCSSVWGIMLLQWQLRFISQGRTFYESIKGKHVASFDISKLTVSDRMRNLVNFFSRRHAYNDLALDV